MQEHTFQKPLAPLRPARGNRLGTPRGQGEIHGHDTGCRRVSAPTAHGRADGVPRPHKNADPMPHADHGPCKTLRFDFANEAWTLFAPFSPFM